MSNAEINNNYIIIENQNNQNSQNPQNSQNQNGIQHHNDKTDSKKYVTIGGNSFLNVDYSDCKEEGTEDKVISIVYDNVSVNKINEKNDEDISAFVSDDNFNRSDSKNIIGLFESIYDGKEECLKDKEYFTVVEQNLNNSQNSDVQYQIKYTNKLGNDMIKCYRKASDLWLLIQKLKNSYPYIIVPNVSSKTSGGSAKNLLVFVLNFINSHETLRNCSEFIKFIEEPRLDEGFFCSLNNKEIYLIEQSGYQRIKDKFYGLLNALGGVEGKSIDDNDMLMKNMSIHYNNILSQYKNLVDSIKAIILTIKEEGDIYKNTSNFILYLNDSFPNYQNSGEILKKNELFFNALSESNFTHIQKGEKLIETLNVLISLIEGACFTLDLYKTFIKKYMDLAQISNNNSNEYNDEMRLFNSLKSKFDKYLSKDTSVYSKLFDEEMNRCLIEFRELLILVNK